MEVLVINMHQDKERLDKIERQLDVTRIEAVDGSKDDMSGTNMMCRYFCTNSMVGIYKSHLKCWQYIIDNNLDYAIILEDDVQVVPDFQKRAQDLVDSTILQWDILLLGCFFCKIDKNDWLSRLYINSAYPKGKEEDINDLLYKPRGWSGAHAYLVSRQGAKNLLSKFKTVTFHVDYVLSHSYLDVFASKQLLATQNTSGVGSYNAKEIPLFRGIKLDNKSVDLDFILTMPVGEVGGVKIHLWLVFKLLCVLMIIYLVTKYVNIAPRNTSTL